jgi:hypothetical protein
MTQIRENDLFASEAWQRHGTDEDNSAAHLLAYNDAPLISMPPLSEFSPATYDPSELHAGHFLGLLWAIAQPNQGWTSFRDFDIDNMAAGAVIFQYPPVRTGWEWKVDRISVSIPGASSAATTAVYIGPQVADAAPDESYLVDYANVLLGSTPSRNVADYPQPLWLTEGDALTIVVAGAAAGSAAAFSRIEGRRRQKP